MADTERPKRLRGAKLLEEGYRAGFAAGHKQGLADAAQAAKEDDTRRRLMEAALAQLRQQQAAKPKRTRQTKTANEANPSGVASGPLDYGGRHHGL